MQNYSRNVEESWRPIVGFEGFYEVSNFGRIRSFIDNHLKIREVPKVLKPFKLTKGYLGVSLKGKTFKIHRLVAQAFIPNPDNLPQINHKDENKENNSYFNLEWCNSQYNLSYGTVRERINSTNRLLGSSLSRKIAQYTIGGDLVREYNSITEALNYNGFKNNSNIIQSCKSNSKTAYGYRWKYIN